jgi:hypothetical protein
MKKRKIILIVLFVSIFLTLNNYTHVFEFKEVLKPLNIENVKEELIKQDVLYHDIVLKQVKLETGHLKYVKHNNLFGFRGNNGYLRFDTWQDAVTYKKAWQLRKYKGGDYYRFLIKVGYAEDSNYIRKLKQM